MWFLKKKNRVALVLGSGGARGLAHIGVIKVLLKNKVPINMIVGSSSGALTGGLFASWKNIEQIEKMVREVTFKDLAQVLVDPNWGGGLIKGGKTLDYLEKLFRNEQIEDLDIPFAAVATDLNTAEEVVFKKGSISEAVRASISVPLVYSPVMADGKQLVDGGVSCPVPVEIAREMGADIIIAVNLDGVYFSEINKTSPSKSTVDVIKDSYFALRYNLAKKEVREADVVIEPIMKYVTDFDFIKGVEAIEAGEKAAEKAMRKIKRLL